MSLKADLPGARQAIVEAGGVPSRPLYVFLQNVATTVDGLSSASGNVTIPALPISENANVVGASGFSVYTQGTLKTGIVRVLLMGDTQNPGNTQYYGSGPTGARGWFSVSDALAASGNVTLSVGADGVTTFDLADLANSGTGAALVKITRDSKGRISGTSSATTSDLAEGSNLYFTNARASSAAPVQSVNGYTGAVALTASDVGAATTAQGAKADSAVQSIVAGTGVSVDATDPHNPVVSATGSGSGDVVGPASATDGDVALFDGTTGKLIKSAGGSFGSLVRAAVLTGLSTATSAVIAATDTVLGALGKLQAQVADRVQKSGDNMTGPLTSTADIGSGGAWAGLSSLFGGAAGGLYAQRNNTARFAALSAGQPSQFIGGRCGGTLTAPAATPTSVGLFDLYGMSFDGTAWQFPANLSFITNELHTGTARGTYAWLRTTQKGTTTLTTRLLVDISGDGAVDPGADNIQSLGSSLRRWSQVYSATGAINTSDAREKTDVTPLTAAELAAAADLSKAIGTYQWLASVAEKGAGAARHHAGLTVQRAVEIMQAHGLDSFRYGFICYDRWDATDAVVDQETGEEIEPARPAGDRYSFRHDELLLFISRGIDARLSALETGASA